MIVQSERTVILRILNQFQELITRTNPDKHNGIIEKTADRIEEMMKNSNIVLTEKDVAKRFPFLSVGALRNMRHRDQGPKYIKIGKSRNGRVYYKPKDVHDWALGHYTNL